eukprot:11798651-Ditylum_brightwellii.AAC.1
MAGCLAFHLAAPAISCVISSAIVSCTDPVLVEGSLEHNQIGQSMDDRPVYLCCQRPTADNT